MRRKHLTTPFAAKAIGEGGRFEGHASVFGVVDAQNDMVVPGAFARSIGAKGARGIKLLWQHDPRQPIGVWEEIREDARGLFVRGRLLLDVQRGREAHALMKAGALDGLSIGFSTVRAVRDEKTGVRRLVELDLWEVSPVTFPANPEARIAWVKEEPKLAELPLATLDHPWEPGAAVARVRAFAGVDQGPGLAATSVQARYRPAFLWVDPAAPEHESAYRLPVADVIRGTLHAVPQALFAAARALTSGPALPGAEQDAVRSSLGRYYARMRSTFADPTLCAPWETPHRASGAAGIRTRRDFERFLRRAGFGARHAKAITAAGFAAARAPAPGEDADLAASLRRAAAVLFQP